MIVKHAECGLTTKYIHRDGSETSIKKTQSCDNTITSDGQLIANETDRNKYSVFISASVGCPFDCSFCHLTIKQHQYERIAATVLLENIKAAITHAIEHDRSMKSRYIKLCWMGMGEAIINPNLVTTITLEVITWAIDKGYAAGLDGVDLSTILPRVTRRWQRQFAILNNSLDQFNINPSNEITVHADDRFPLAAYKHRSLFRVFYSLHTVDQDTRDKMIPNATAIDDAVAQMIEYSNHNTRNVIFHLLFIEGLNDSEQHIQDLIHYIKTNDLDDYEFRVLRYNGVPGHKYRESRRIHEIMADLANSLPYVKGQISSGKDVLAACGQFYAGTNVITSDAV